MPLIPGVDDGGLLEYSVVTTDRSLNYMSKNFKDIMRDLSCNLKTIFNCEHVAVFPGSGTTGMEAVARHFGENQKALIIRNGWFSYRWTQILETMNRPDAPKPIVMSARRAPDSVHWIPAPVEDVVKKILEEKPKVVFAPHVETASAIMLPDDYVRRVGDAVHDVGGIFVLDCIASGTDWVDMKKLNIDVVVSAPQKGWSSPAGAGMVMMTSRGYEALKQTTTSSFSQNMNKWMEIMEAYEKGQWKYHGGTMPTDTLRILRDRIDDLMAYGLEKAKSAQIELGERIRALVAQRGYCVVAAEGFRASGIVVCYTDDDEMKTGTKFAKHGIQSAACVPLQCGEGPDFKTFRFGLFGLEKSCNMDRTVKTLEDALERIESH